MNLQDIKVGLVPAIAGAFFLLGQLWYFVSWANEQENKIQSTEIRAEQAAKERAEVKEAIKEQTKAMSALEKAVTELATELRVRRDER